MQQRAQGRRGPEIRAQQPERRALLLPCGVLLRGNGRRLPHCDRRLHPVAKQLRRQGVLLRENRRNKK